jgi:membrane protein DedA with SNARE-associated domain
MPGSRHQTLHSSGGTRHVAVLVVVLAGFAALSIAGDALSPVLLGRHRLALVALTPRTAYLIAATRDLPLPCFLLVAVARLCAADPVHFALGRATGPAVLARAGRTRGLRRLARRLPSESSPLWLVAVALSPTAKTMVMTAGAGVRAGRVAAANVVGTVVRVLVIWRAGHAFPTVGETVAVVSVWIAVPSGVAAAVLVVVRNRQRLWAGLLRLAARHAPARWPRLPDPRPPIAPAIAGDSTATV